MTISSSSAWVIGLLKKIDSQAGASKMDWLNTTIHYPCIYALVTIDDTIEEQIFEFWSINNMTQRNDIFEIIPNVWVFTDPPETFAFPEIYTNTALLCITDVNDLTYSQLSRLLLNYVKEQVFSGRSRKHSSCKELY